MDDEELREKPLARVSGEILEIAFARDTQMNDWVDWVDKSVGETQPAALVVNFHEAPAHDLHDAFAAVIGPLVRYRDKDKAGLRPCAVVATDQKNKMLHGLLESAKLLPMLDIAYFEDVPKAVEHLQTRMKDTRPD